jgi:hypothetical protein
VFVAASSGRDLSSPTDRKPEQRAADDQHDDHDQNELTDPGEKPRASSSAVSRPPWAAAKIMAINVKASCAATLPGIAMRWRLRRPCPRYHDEHGG